MTGSYKSTLVQLFVPNTHNAMLGTKLTLMTRTFKFITYCCSGTVALQISQCRIKWNPVIPAQQLFICKLNLLHTDKLVRTTFIVQQFNTCSVSLSEDIICATFTAGGQNCSDLAPFFFQVEAQYAARHKSNHTDCSVTEYRWKLN